MCNYNDHIKNAKLATLMQLNKFSQIISQIDFM